MKPDRASLRRLVLGVVLLAAIAFAFLNRDVVEFKAVEGWIEGFGYFAPLIFIALYAAATILFLPGSLLTMVGGALFGPWLGTLFNLTGAILGATLAFLMSRYLASDWVRKKAGKKLTRLIEGVDAEGWRFVAFTRLVPLFPFNLLNYALGLTRISLIQYVAATFICMIPGGFAYTYLGFAGREALSGGESAVEKGLLALGLIACVLFLPRLVHRIRDKLSAIDKP